MTILVLPEDHAASPVAVANALGHTDLKAGDTDPELNKVIQDLVLSTDFFIVYVATDLSIQWRTTDEHQQADHCGEVLNRVATLEVQSHFISDRTTLNNIRRHIAEGLARCLDGQPLKNSEAILKEAEIEIRNRNRETSWSWYFTLAYQLTAGCGILICVLWLLRAEGRHVLGIPAFDVVLGTLCGAIGALLSVTMRGDRLNMDANAGPMVHRLEGLSRIGAGAGGAFFVSLAIKSGVILGGAHFNGSSLALILAFCIAAGGSERVVPSLITTFERAANSGSSRVVREGKGSKIANRTRIKS